MRDNLSSNGVPVKENQVVLYSTGTQIVKCLVDKITTMGRNEYLRVHRVHLVYLSGGKIKYNDWPVVGQKFVAKAAQRLWVLDETKDKALEELYNI